MQRLIVTGPRQVELEEIPLPACGPDEVLLRAWVTVISFGNELRVYRAIPVDQAGRFLPTYLPLSRLISHYFHWSHLPDAYSRLDEGRRPD